MSGTRKRELEPVCVQACSIKSQDASHSTKCQYACVTQSPSTYRTSEAYQACFRVPCPRVWGSRPPKLPTPTHPRETPAAHRLMVVPSQHCGQKSLLPSSLGSFLTKGTRMFGTASRLLTLHFQPRQTHKTDASNTPSLVAVFVAVFLSE